MKENIETLLKRREEIRIEINKLQKEYFALGEIITFVLKNKKKDKGEER